MTNLNNLELNRSVNTDLLCKQIKELRLNLIELNKGIFAMPIVDNFMNHYVQPGVEHYDNEYNQISDVVSLRTVIQALDNLGIEVGIRELVYAIDEIEADFPFEYLRENEESSYEQ